MIKDKKGLEGRRDISVLPGSMDRRDCCTEKILKDLGIEMGSDGMGRNQRLA